VSEGKRFINQVKKRASQKEGSDSGDSQVARKILTVIEKFTAEIYNTARILLALAASRPDLETSLDAATRSFKVEKEQRELFEEEPPAFLDPLPPRYRSFANGQYATALTPDFSEGMLW
jgi:hypothetical protein